MSMSSSKSGKKITGIYLGKEKVIIKFSDEKMNISKSAYLEMMLYEGKELSDKEIKKIKDIDELDKYLTSAKKYVLASLRSEKEVKDKLLNIGAKPRQINHIVNELKKYSLIDDASLMKDLIDNASYKNYGEARIKEILYKKGISKELIDPYSFEDRSELSKAKRLLPSLEKKFSKYNYRLMKEHIYQALLRYGYSYEVANKVIENVKSNDTKHELEILKKDYLKVKNRYIKKYNKDEVDFKINQYLLSKGYRQTDINKIKGEKR